MRQMPVRCINLLTGSPQRKYPDRPSKNQAAKHEDKCHSTDKQRSKFSKSLGRFLLGTVFPYSMETDIDSLFCLSCEVGFIVLIFTFTGSGQQILILHSQVKKTELVASNRDAIFGSIDFLN